MEHEGDFEESSIGADRFDELDQKAKDLERILSVHLDRENGAALCDALFRMAKDMDVEGKDGLELLEKAQLILPPALSNIKERSSAEKKSIALDWARKQREAPKEHGEPKNENILPPGTEVDLSDFERQMKDFRPEER